MALILSENTTLRTTRSFSTICNGATAVFATDVDSDGDIDVLSASLNNKIAWYENDGSESFTARYHKR